MPYIIERRDAISRNQSKHVGEDGRLRYDADGSEVFPGPTGTRRSIPTERHEAATLDDARVVAWKLAGWTPYAPDVPDSIHDLRRAHDGFKEGVGGTIGPLADGAVIEVRPVAERSKS